MDDVVLLIQEKIKYLLELHIKNHFDRSDVLNDIIYYSLFSGGKFLRGIIVMEMSKLFNIDEEHSLILASIVEMIHCYSLIHDDLPALDNSDMRRSMQSAHKKFGEANALLAGSLLLILAIEIANKYFSSDLVSKINEQVILMIRGQTVDLAFKSHELNYNEILDMYKLKTGSMFVLASLMGFIVQKSKNYNVEYKQILEDFGYDFGILFQICDDVSDLGSDEKTIVNILSFDKLKELILIFKNKCKKHLIDLNIKSNSYLFTIINAL